MKINRSDEGVRGVASSSDVHQDKSGQWDVLCATGVRPSLSNGKHEDKT